MRTAIITDNHFGGRGDSPLFDRFFERFYTKVFFPILDELKITQVQMLGDTFDRRKFINYLSLYNCKDYFFDPLYSRNIEVNMLVGNHDTFYKNTNNVNSPEILLGEYSNINIFSKPDEIKIDTLDVMLIPWVCPENLPDTKRLMEATKAEVAFGHLEVAGFEMHRGQFSDVGVDPSTYQKFEQVFSGHFHHRSTKGNISYLGNPYELTWADYDDPRGFHIYDTDTRELKFVENPFKMFHKIFYDDDSSVDYLNLDVKPFAEKFVKVVVVTKNKQLLFDKLLDRLYNVHPAELKIIENITDYDEEAHDTETIDVEDMATMMDHYVDTVETDLDKERLKSFLKTLYVEAKALEDAEA
jgi:DNA repair exonuclease SbcCD nuclease subunit